MGGGDQIASTQSTLSIQVSLGAGCRAAQPQEIVGIRRRSGAIGIRSHTAECRSKWRQAGWSIFVIQPGPNESGAVERTCSRASRATSCHDLPDEMPPRALNHGSCWCARTPPSAYLRCRLPGGRDVKTTRPVRWVLALRVRGALTGPTPSAGAETCCLRE
jgi:hypothetical protein